MIRIAQFGEGNFLRTFVDAYFDTLNREGGDYAVTIIKPIPSGSLDHFRRQNNKYHIVLRGMQNGNAAEEVYPIESVDAVIDPFIDPETFYALARDPALRLIVSNTTEAGICYNASDTFDGFETVTYPAKLTKFLYERFKAGLDGVYLLPVELIENNANALSDCVAQYIDLWQLPDTFAKWNRTQNRYCNTLVDRIVSGHPRDAETLAHLIDLIGEEDALSSVGEPFGLWAIEKKGDIETYIQAGHYNIDVVVTEDIPYYKKRKVRVLNGSHTNLVAAGLLCGAETVYDCMTNEKLHAFFSSALDEIIPFVSDDNGATRAFADDVEVRFCNPFLNHRLSDIALNSISKWKARILPTFRDYYQKNGQIPSTLTIGFAYLMALYMTRTDECSDNAAYLDFFRAEKPVRDFMTDAEVWGEDLTAYPDFADTVESHIMRILAGEVLL